jgi:hypothetical protein
MTVISSSAPCAAIPLVRARPQYLNPDAWHRVLTLHMHRILCRLPLILQHRLTDSENLQPVVRNVGVYFLRPTSDEAVTSMADRSARSGACRNTAKVYTALLRKNGRSLCECGRFRWLKTIYMPTLELPLELVPVPDPLFKFDVVFRSILP